MELPSTRIHGICALLMCLAGVSACTQSSSDSYGHEFGTISLAAGQTEKVRTGGAYRILRVCNTAESSGTVVVLIDNEQPKTLIPGLCTEDYGNSIEMNNQSASSAKIAYRAMSDADLSR